MSQIETVAAAETALAHTKTAISELDALIGRLASMLDLIQPRAPGKISLRFIRTSGHGHTEPIFVAWRWTAEGRRQNKILHYDILDQRQVTRAVKHYGPFRGTQRDVRNLINRLQRLIERRKGLVLLMGRYIKATTLSLRTTQSTLKKLETDLQDEWIEIQRRHTSRMAGW